MATISRKNSGWRVQIRRKGVNKSKTFRTKAEAQAWANAIESQIAAGEYSDVPDITFADLIHKYVREITPQKKARGMKRCDCTAWRICRSAKCGLLICA